jgi:hypothetical protein
LYKQSRNSSSIALYSGNDESSPVPRSSPRAFRFHLAAQTWTSYPQGFFLQQTIQIVIEMPAAERREGNRVSMVRFRPGPPQKQSLSNPRAAAVTQLPSAFRALS